MEPAPSNCTTKVITQKQKVKSRITEELFPEFGSDEELENISKQPVYKSPEFKGKTFLTNSKLAEASRALNLSDDDSSEKRDKRRIWLHPHPHRESSHKLLVPISHLFKDSFHNLMKRKTIKPKEEYLKKHCLKLSSNKVLALMYDIERRKHNQVKEASNFELKLLEDNEDD